MLTRKRRAVPAPKISFVSPTSWDKGVRTDLDADRIPIDSLRVMENVQLTQNGTVAPRPGLRPYGIQPTGTVMGQLYEYVRLNTAVTPSTPETWLVWMENRSGTVKMYTAKDGGTPIEVTGKTFSTTGNPRYEQVAGKVIIATASDYLAYMDVQTQTITTLTALSQPTSAPTATPTGISGSNVTLRYRYAAANLGETAASPAGTAGVSALRETWNGTTQYVTITGARIAGAQRYNIYVGTEAGSEYFLDTIADPGTGTNFTYVDTGSIAETSTRLAPAGDSTAGPRVSRATNIKGQIYLVGDVDNRGRIWFGGTGNYALDFSSYNGGGWVEPNPGGKDFPVKVVPFRDGKGTPMATCLSKGTNGAGKRYLLSPTTTTVGTTTISYMSVQEDNGQEGTDSPDGVILKNDAIFYPSRNGFKTSKTQASIQNLISTVGVSGNIRDDVGNLSASYMDKCVGLEYNDVLYWSLPFSSTKNNQIWMVDLRQQGAWVKPWYIACDWMVLYADNSDGKTKFLMLVNNVIYQVDPSMATNDNGTAYQTNVGTGVFKFNEDGTLWGSVIDVTFVFLRPQGNINLGVGANTEDGTIPFTDVMPSSSTQSVSSWGRFGWGARGWGGLTPDNTPVSVSQGKKQWTIDIDEECNGISCNINTVDAGVKYQLSEIIVRYVPIGYKEIDNS